MFLHNYDDITNDHELFNKQTLFDVDKSVGGEIIGGPIKLE